MEQDFTAFEYKKIRAGSEEISFYLDAYESFGWQLDERISNLPGSGMCMLRLKRDRKIINKMELTRLQRNFEGCMDAISQLEKEKTRTAKEAAITTGIIGCAFMAGSVFAVTAAKPLIILSIILAVPGIILWIIPYFIYQQVKREKTADMDELIEKRYDEIDALMRKGNSLL